MFKNTVILAVLLSLSFISEALATECGKGFERKVFKVDNINVVKCVAKRSRSELICEIRRVEHISERVCYRIRSVEPIRSTEPSNPFKRAEKSPRYDDLLEQLATSNGGKVDEATEKKAGAQLLELYLENEKKRLADRK